MAANWKKPVIQGAYARPKRSAHPLNLKITAPAQKLSVLAYARPKLSAYPLKKIIAPAYGPRVHS